ncbi:cyclopropane-fatty-acyl-phospholipid synthase family protein [Sphingomonas sp.]|jgi:cyclopropane-fatty-acyl-phospholipid synthase|uniref:cyclopropane-fatty-acyl-phospholipid synthase family protein n=1 Tax=Sphingomonas sp. TaxID=28214 RepID=UPI002D802930|nr:cyclopropane-fatty-acyl-phospholipid synthase family protein [Sphingomonas sp.]HEU0043227.1 cyclopropane-fatty-acyl-phospholipid synthase family protein [Sphingomonas sp.]
MALIDLFLRRIVQRGELIILDHDGRRARFGAPDPTLRPVTLRFADAGVGNAILRNASLGAGETFMDGRLAIEEGDVLDLVTLMTVNDKWEAGQNRLEPSPSARAFNAVKYRLDRWNMERASRRNVAHHYDLSDRLYALFLDRDRQYSCAYFTDPANSLEQAQADKLAHIAAKLHIRPGMRVLDIGCGWGGMALYLNRMLGAEVLGVTLSEEQLKVARRRARDAGVADKVKFALIDYRRVTGQFDRIVSVGMFEHVGPAHYRAFMRKCRDLLTPEGVMLLHTIGRLGAPGVTDAWTAKYIFPGGYNPALSEIVRAYEGLRLFPTDIEVLRLHYAWTLREWYARTTAHEAEIVALYDARFFRMWTFYLAGAVVAFEHGGMCNYQLQFSRSRTALPVTRDYMLEGERALRG